MREMMKCSAARICEMVMRCDDEMQWPAAARLNEKIQEKSPQLCETMSATTPHDTLHRCHLHSLVAYRSICRRNVDHYM